MVGVDGDYYLNATTGDIFQKRDGVWVRIANMSKFASAPVVISQLEPQNPFIGMIWVEPISSTVYIYDYYGEWEMIYQNPNPPIPNPNPPNPPMIKKKK